MYHQQGNRPPNGQEYLRASSQGFYFPPPPNVAPPLQSPGVALPYQQQPPPPAQPSFHPPQQHQYQQQQQPYAQHWGPFPGATPYAMPAPSGGPAFTPQAAPTQAPTMPSYVAPAAEKTREEYAEEAVQSTAQHWIAEQLRRSTGRPPAGGGVGGGTGTGDLQGDNGGSGEARARSAFISRGTPQSAAAGSQPKKVVEFVMGSPRYQKRVAVLLCYALFGIVPLMSSLTLTVGLGGLAAMYTADYLGYQRGTVFVMLVTVMLFGVSLLLSNFHAAITSFGPMLLILDIVGVLLTATAAALLHFRWLQEAFPELICTLERLVMATMPVLAMPLLLATITALCGARYAPFYFLVTLCVEHYFFYSPLVSSFIVIRKPDATPEAQAAADLDDYKKIKDEVDMEGMTPQQLNGRGEAIAFSILLIILPVLVYNAFQSNWEDNIMANLLNSLGLLCGGAAFFCLSPSADSLWFLAPETTDNVLSQLEYDPLGLREVVKEHRVRVLAVVGVLGVHWAAYRFLSSRYGYIFDGVPSPYNILVLLAALYLSVFVAIRAKVLLDADSRGENIAKSKFAEARIVTILGTIVVVVLFCILGDVPGVFYFPAVLSVTSFNLFLLDRTNGGPMISFIVFSSLLLLWWMFRTFSFIVTDLHVFGEAGTVPTPVVAVSVLWCYVLGCLCFMVSFTKNKVPLIALLFMHALQLTGVEHVLYSQREEDVYSGSLVLLTTAMGVAMAYRLYRNGVLGVSAASFVASCYLAKVFTFLVEVTSSYYYQADAEQYASQYTPIVLALEITGGWWVALVAGYVVMVMEMEDRKRIETRHARRLVYLYTVSAVLLALGSVRNVQRAVYEFVTQSYVAADELPHIAPGTFMATLAGLMIPFITRLQERYPFVHRPLSIFRGVAVLGVVLLAVQPTRVAEAQETSLNYEFPHADKGRYAVLTGLCLILGGRVLPMQKIPAPVRVLYWLVAALSLALGISTTLLPVPTVPLFSCINANVFLTMLLVDMAHYRALVSIEAWVVHGLNLCAMTASFIMLQRANTQLVAASPENSVELWGMHDQGRTQLLSIAAVVNLVLAIMLKCRLEGKPLLPNCVPVTENMYQQLGVVCNYSVCLAVVSLSVLNFWSNDNEPAFYVTFSLLLLLLVDDGIMTFDLGRENVRYFPVLAFLAIVLWACALFDAWSSGLSVPHKVHNVGTTLAVGTGTLPAFASLLMYLWRGRKRGGASMTTVVVTIVLCAVTLVVSSRRAIHWLAIVGICGQSARVFEGRLRGRKNNGRV